MRSALICVFLALFVRTGGGITVATTDDFKPTPIPLEEWHPPAPPSPPAPRYWEEALRHSVYLALVRDKIDQLIAQGSGATAEPDDRQLWETIKAAPFDRAAAEDPPTYGDVTTLAKGRLLQQRAGLLFAEDGRDGCYNETCMRGVDALWSVKRVKQWEPSSPPSKYHYELTFSVITQPPNKQKKPYENPIRTFTVRESTPENVVDRPKEHRQFNPTPSAVQRPERAIWYHKNVVPTQRPYLLDRIFSSFLFDDDDEDEPPRKLRAHHYPPHPFPQHSKIGHVGSPSEPQTHKRPGPYKITYKYHTKQPQFGPPIMPQYHSYTDSAITNPYPAQSADHVSNYAPVKPVRPPTSTFTPSEPVTSPANATSENSTAQNEVYATEGSSRAPEIITVASRPYPGYIRPMPTNHYPEHIRPPVYNAPPGVFVTMDKKPFKPMPPIKIIHSTKPYHHKYSSRPPHDFRPSPQVLDVQFSEPDPLSDTAFRPITMNYDNNSQSTTEKNTSPSTRHDDDYKRKTNRKPPKKHENIKANRVTTSAPEIITAHSNIEVETAEDAEWNKLLGELAQSTPEVTTESDKENDIEISTSAPTTSTTSVTSTTPKRRTTTTSRTTTAPATTTTPRPKRTRPPPDFYLKPEYKDKKKHKRRTTTKAPTTKNDDLVPQASSAAASSTTKSQKDSTKTSTQKTPSTSTSTTTSTTSTTTVRPTAPVPATAPPTPRPTPSTTPRPAPSTTPRPALSTTPRPALSTTRVSTTTPPPTTQAPILAVTTQPKNKNRFRQSTLLQKGTSVKHDKWSANLAATPNSDKNKTVVPVTGYPPRRKGSNFQGYVSSTPKHTDNEEVHVSSPYKSRAGTVSSSTEAMTTTEESSYDDRLEEQEIDNETAASNFNEEIEYQDDNFETEQEQQGASSDHNEFIFNVTVPPTEEKKEESENKVDEAQPVETTTVVTTTSVPKNKTKCSKKKKNQNLTTTTERPELAEYVEEESEDAEPSTSTSTTTTEPEEDIFSLFGYSLDDVTSTTKKEQNSEATESHKNSIRPEDDFEDFFDSLEVKPRKEKDAEYDDNNEKDTTKDNDEEEDDSPFNNDDVRDFARNSDEELDEYQVRPLSFLELMSMD